MRYLLASLLLVAGCATQAPDNVWDEYPAESVRAAQCVQEFGVEPLISPVQVVYVDDGVCSGGLAFSRDRHLWTVPVEVTPVLGCYQPGDYLHIYVEEDAVWHELPDVISHEMVHLMLDVARVPVSEHHFITRSCGL